MRTVPGVAAASVNLAAEQAEVRFAAHPDAAAVVAAIEAAGYAASRDTIVLAIQGMTCASCVARVQRALGAVPGVIGAEVNLATERATVTVPRGAVAVGDLIGAVAAAGYTAVPVAAEEAGCDADQD
ncbi:heavy-metal-associated domain-containing protein, partial [Elioraea sp.]|uniref:heavy-metal-associated domain-containing protein n=1 Tax=Elioraea sp. TaxID=2185103 RepID=UPI003F729603